MAVAGGSEVALSPMADVLAAVRAGEPVVVLADDAGRVEGYLLVPAQAVTAPRLQQLLDAGGGLVYVPVTAERARHLSLAEPPAGPGSGAGGAGQSAMTVPVDLADPDVRGLSVAERARCIRHLADPRARPQDFRSPGHVFPVKARPRGLFDRLGMAEAATDLVRAAGMHPVAATCKVLADDGSDAGAAHLARLADRHGYPVTSVEAVLAHRRASESAVTLLGESTIPTPHGVFSLHLFRFEPDGGEHVAMVHGQVRGVPGVLVRVQRECLLGDVFYSRFCGCRTRLEGSLARIAAAGAGVLVYLRGPEWRLEASHEADRGHALAPAGQPDIPAAASQPARDYGPAAQILLSLGVTDVRLLGNRPVVPYGLAHPRLRISGPEPISQPVDLT